MMVKLLSELLLVFPLDFPPELKGFLSPEEGAVKASL